MLLHLIRRKEATVQQMYTSKQTNFCNGHSEAESRLKAGLRSIQKIIYSSSYDGSF